MENAITAAIRKIVQEELKCRQPEWTRVRAQIPVIEMPLRSGEVERYYPVAEVSRLLGMSRGWVYDRIDDGTFVVANFGDGKSKRRIPASSVNAFILTHTYA